MILPKRFIVATERLKYHPRGAVYEFSYIRNSSAIYLRKAGTKENHHGFGANLGEFSLLIEKEEIIPF